MRIAYIAPYQGPSLIAERPVVCNRSLAGTQKIDLITALLQKSSHEVEIISQGEVDSFHWRFYPSLRECESSHASVSVYYSSALPVRFVNGYWSSIFTLLRFNTRHKWSPFDVVIIYNTKRPQIACAAHAIGRLRLPVILEYEDDAFVHVGGEPINGFRSRMHANGSARVIKSVSGCIAASPRLLSQFPQKVPSLLLRGVVGSDIERAVDTMGSSKKNLVLFCGTHTKSKGIVQLIQAWKIARLPDWELHITGCGELTEELRRIANGTGQIVFHGLVGREELVRLLCSARICMNPHDVSHAPGNVFAFKIIEYLAAGAHVISTPMGELEKELEKGITYISTNEPYAIAGALKQVIYGRRWELNATQYVGETYGPDAVSKSLDLLVHQVVHS